MAKQPAFQFYPADWLKDPSLQMCSFATQGIWINILCCMWEQEERGKITGTQEEFCRLLGCSCEEFVIFLSEIRQKFVADVTECNGNVTLINRRMYRDQKARNQSKKRVSEYRKKKSEPMKRSCNANVTHTSSSSSSTSVINNYSNGDTPSVTKPLQKHQEIEQQKLPDGFDNENGFPLCEYEVKERIAMCDKLMDSWNDFAEHQIKGVARMALMGEIVAAMKRYRLTWDMLVETVGNYREAVNAPNTKAKQWSFGRWLNEGMANYRPGFYAIDNYVWEEEKAGARTRELEKLEI